MCRECLAKSWAAYSRSYVAMAIGSIAIMLFVAAMFGASLFLVFKNPAVILTDEYLSLELSPLLPAGVGIVAFAILFGIVLQAGFYGMAMESLGKKTDLPTMIRTMKKVWKESIGAFLLVGLIYIIIISFFVMVPIGIGAGSFGSQTALYSVLIAGILIVFLISVFLTLVYPSLISGKGAVASIRDSVKVASSSYFKLLLLVAFFFVLSFASRELLGLIPAIGNILGVLISSAVIMPWQAVAFSAFYKKYASKRKSSR